MSEQGRSGFVDVGHRGGESPRAKFGLKSPKPRQREFGLHASLGSHQFVPFIDDDAAERIEFGRRIDIGKQQRNAFGRGDENGGQSLTLAFANGG